MVTCVGAIGPQTCSTAISQRWNGKKTKRSQRCEPTLQTWLGTRSIQSSILFPCVECRNHHAFALGPPFSCWSFLIPFWIWCFFVWIYARFIKYVPQDMVHLRSLFVKFSTFESCFFRIRLWDSSPSVTELVRVCGDDYWWCWETVCLNWGKRRSFWSCFFGACSKYS